MNFCSECNNLLTPKADRKHNRLVFVCNTCQVVEESKTNRVDVLSFSGSASTEAKIHNSNLILDPTLPRKFGDKCPKCGHDGPVYYQPSDDNMQLAFVCSNRDCVHTWQ